MKREIYVIAHDIRSAHNVGALFRLADGIGVTTLFLTGYTPYPPSKNDERLPHIQEKLRKQITKTALGAESTVPWQHHKNPTEIVKNLKAEGAVIVGLEQAPSSTPLHAFTPPQKLCVMLGREVEGIDKDLLKLCDNTVEIPMLGQKESHNVVQATAMTLFYCRFHPFKV